MVITGLNDVRILPAPSPPVTGILDLFCAVTIVKLGGFELNLMKVPRGYCTLCCPLDESRHIEYWYSNRHNPKNRLVSQIHKGSSKAAGVNPEWPTVILVHGWSESQNSVAMRRLKDAHLQRPEPWNIFIVNWNSLATYLFYDRAAKNTRVVGRNLGRFLVKIFQSGEINMDKLHLIGFSLGSHIVGFAAKYFQKNTGITLPWITGLDPARPNFQNNGCNDRLCITDAHFLDIIHTNSGGLGLPQPIGHVDFYPNGGTAYQPGCAPANGTTEILKIVERFVPCSHSQAVMFYSFTILDPTIFPVNNIVPHSFNENSIQSDSPIHMGFGVSHSLRGVYYLTTFAYPKRSQIIWDQIYRYY